MSDFSPQLRTIASRLPIPEPARARVLLEIATDMDDLFRHLVEGGMSEEKAAEEVGDSFDLSDEALGELSRIHNSPLSCSLESLSGQARSTWERVILGLVALFVCLGLGSLFFRPSVYRDASPLAYVLAGILMVGLGVGCWKAVSLFGGRKPTGPIPRRGLRFLPRVSLFLLVLGFGGIWVELYLSALAIRGTPRLAMVHLVEWLFMASATLVVALSGALLTALLWFFLENRARHLEERAAATILGNPA